MATKLDLFEFGRYTERSGKPLELERRFHVTGLINTNTSRTILLALDAASIPQNGDVHPDDGDMRVESRVVEPTGSDSAYVTCIYGWNPANFEVVSGGSALQQIQSSRVGPFENDAPIVLEHPELPKIQGQTRQGVRITASVGRASVVGVQTLAGVSGSKRAAQHIANNVGRISANGTTFLFTDDARQWLCASGDFEPIAYSSQGDLSVARFTWTFIHKLEKWNPIIVDARAPDGRPFHDVNTQAGATDKIFWYQEANFPTALSTLP